MGQLPSYIFDKKIEIHKRCTIFSVERAQDIVVCTVVFKRLYHKLDMPTMYR